MAFCTTTKSTTITQYTGIRLGLHARRIITCKTLSIYLIAGATCWSMRYYGCGFFFCKFALVFRRSTFIQRLCQTMIMAKEWGWMDVMNGA
jgi:accessory gene regulator protein AgrB